MIDHSHCLQGAGGAGTSEWWTRQLDAELATWVSAHTSMHRRNDDPTSKETDAVQQGITVGS